MHFLTSPHQIAGDTVKASHILARPVLPHVLLQPLPLTPSRQIALLMIVAYFVLGITYYTQATGSTPRNGRMAEGGGC